MAAAEEQLDLVFLDLGLPDLDGTEVIRRIRSFSDVPIIVLSVRDRQADKVDALCRRGRLRDEAVRRRGGRRAAAAAIQRSKAGEQVPATLDSATSRSISAASS